MRVLFRLGLSLLGLPVRGVINFTSLSGYTNIILLVTQKVNMSDRFVILL
uniref:Uncharacterized protein n=1 Tax=Siphoviridae sp. ctTC45 TaxID=2827573 RepID=A0A8S5LQS3_9CAUD|nr:MAG TPA: hypothetical protein [Siphoviridae sp. ctTC45]